MSSHLVSLGRSPRSISSEGRVSLSHLDLTNTLGAYSLYTNEKRPDSQDSLPLLFLHLVQLTSAPHLPVGILPQADYVDTPHVVHITDHRNVHRGSQDSLLA